MHRFPREESIYAETEVVTLPIENRPITPLDDNNEQPVQEEIPDIPEEPSEGVDPTDDQRLIKHEATPEPERTLMPPTPIYVIPQNRGPGPPPGPPPNPNPFPNAPPNVIVPVGGDEIILEGCEPQIFEGDRAKSDEFMHELKIFQFTNADHPIMTNPYHRVAHTLTYVRGLAVAEYR